jgi:membrane protease YdiL (CAAX protease family)
MPNEAPEMRRMPSVLGLAIALLGIPAVILGFRAGFGEIRSVSIALAREIAVLALTGALLWIVVAIEKRPLTSIGLGTAPFGKSILWGLVGLLACAAGLAASLGIAKVFGWPFGGGGSGWKPPIGVTLVTVVRAGFCEEVCYRGYSIERLREATGSRLWSIATPLAIFAAFHYRQGPAGILIALVLGAILTALYLRRRDVVACAIAHFLADFPNVLLAILAR